MTQPLKLRGFQKWDVFCNAVNNMIDNPACTVKVFWLPCVDCQDLRISSP